jgi:hypothetical protein
MLEAPQEKTRIWVHLQKGVPIDIAVFPTLTLRIPLRAEMTLYAMMNQNLKQWESLRKGNRSIREYLGVTVLTLYSYGLQS